jgi:hypothetical protein
VDEHVHRAMLQRLKAADRLAELLARAQISQRLFEHRLPGASQFGWLAASARRPARAGRQRDRFLG